MSQKSRAYISDSKYGLAIVTGGSSGIGNSIIELVSTLELAPRVFNLSRRKPASFTIDPAHSHLECDLANREQRQLAFKDLEQAIDREPDRQGPILLVNNAGVGSYGPIELTQTRTHLALIELNICALVELTTRILPFIKQRGGTIMNIASIAAFQGTPYMATYAATKTFVLNWTLALNEELRRSSPSAHALAVCPGPTRTDFFKNAGMSHDILDSAASSDEVAKQAIRAALRSRALLVTGFRNRLLARVASLTPHVLRTRIAAIAVKRYRPSPNGH